MYKIFGIQKMREEQKMALFVCGLVAGVAVCCLIEFLYNRICPLAKNDKVKNWEGKRAKYGVSYKDITSD